MPRFCYTAFFGDGTLENGAVEAANELAALERIAGLGLTVTEIAPDEERRPRSAGRKPSLAQQADLAEQLAVLFGAGLPVLRVTEIVARSNVCPIIRRHFVRMEQMIADGTSFDLAIAQASAGLSPLFAIMASIGQRAGRPGMQMLELASALRRQQRITAQIGGALVYPAILLAGGLGVLVLMAQFLAPRLEVIFTSVGRPVPPSIAGFTALGAFLSFWGLPLVAGFVAVSFWAMRAWRQPDRRLRGLVQKVPLVGPVLGDAALASVTRAVQLMMEAGLPLAEALRETALIFVEVPQSRPFHDAANALEEGIRASTIFATAPEIPPLLQEMFRIGEEANTLPRVLSVVATALEDNVERRLQRIMALLTPFLILLIGGVIALIVASVMGAVLSVNDLAL